MGTYSLWNQRDLAFMRAVQNDNLPDRASIQRITTTPNGEGGVTKNKTTIASNIPCRVMTVTKKVGNTGDTHMWGNREANEINVLITLPWDTDVRVEDEVTVTSYENGASHSYGITALDDAATTKTAIRCRAENLR